MAGEKDVAPTPECPECGRPLQKDREVCIYCGRKLTAEDLKRVSDVLDEETVRKQVEQAEAILKVSGGAMMSRRGKLMAKIAVITLSALAVLFISWVSEWNPLVIGLAVAFFSLPVWHVLRRL